MTANSEARKRAEDAARGTRATSIAPQERAAYVVQRRREVTQQALEAIMSGASFTDADALLDQFDTLGVRVVVEGEGLIHG